MNTLVKLLVIDDDEVDRLQLKRALKATGLSYELTECHDVQRALEDIAKTAYDCIFLDYLLPGLNGLTLLKSIRDRGITAPVVIITSQGNESIAVDLMKAGASDYIIKNDITPQLLGQVLRNAIRMSEVMREREMALQALRDSEARLAEAQRIARTGNWEFSPLNNVLHWSQEMYNILHVMRTTEPSVENCMGMVDESDRELVEDTWARALAGESFNIDFKTLTANGLKYVNIQGYVVKESDNTIKKIIGTMQDVTERKLFEQEIMKAREQAENSMKVREIFLANMSHEIRTPMNAILGFTRLLYESELTDEQRSFIDAIHFSGENLLVIINDVLDLSKIQSGKMTIEKTEFGIHEVLKGVISVMKPKTQEKGLKLISLIDPKIPSHLKGDPVRLNQILTNLISNAIKFTEKGSVTIEVNATAGKKNDMFLQFKVTDTGIGIPEDKLSLIFENFVQATADTTRKFGGTGLGLTIVKNLIELQEGEISVSSELGSGSTFTVHLPFERADMENNTTVSEELPGVGSFDELRDVRLLVVEDNAFNQLLVKKVLTKAGCRVDIANNGLEAIAYLKASKYDVVLMDVQMPEMDGYTATQYIREKLPRPLCQIPIIAMTAHAFDEDVNRCLAVGMNDHVSKPFKAEELYVKIIKCVGLAESANVIVLNTQSHAATSKIDLRPIYELSDGDSAFLNELIFVYDKQTPVFIEKLKGYTKSHNFEAIKAICHQIKSSYGLLGLAELDKCLTEISEVLGSPDAGKDMMKLSSIVNDIISLISAINQEVKRSLRKTG